METQERASTKVTTDNSFLFAALYLSGLVKKKRKEKTDNASQAKEIHQTQPGLQPEYKVIKLEI